MKMTWIKIYNIQALVSLTDYLNVADRLKEHKSLFSSSRCMSQITGSRVKTLVDLALQATWSEQRKLLIVRPYCNHFSYIIYLEKNWTHARFPRFSLPLLKCIHLFLYYIDQNTEHLYSSKFSFFTCWLRNHHLTHAPLRSHMRSSVQASVDEGRQGRC